MGERLDGYRQAGRRGSPLLASGNPVYERFSEIYGTTFEAGALSTKVKEMLALVISIVRDCEDCITYHMIRLAEERASREELFELFALTLVVGGSTNIPTLRRAALLLEELEQEAAGEAG
jgi:AhpD family alkylhydroperoxidase